MLKSIQGELLIFKENTTLKIDKTFSSTILSFKAQLREFFHENFAERVVILLNCSSGRKVT